MTRRRVIIAAAVMLIVLIGSAFLTYQRLLQPPVAYAFVEETTLVVLKGDVELQHQDGTRTTVRADTPVRVGDRIRTGPASYAAVTYFDGSSTQLDPETEIVIERLDRAPRGGQNTVSFHQESGATWNRVERLVDNTILFETTTANSRVSARGTEYVVRIDAGGVTIVEAVTDSVTVEAAGRSVTLQPGFQTAIVPGQPPATPVAVNTPHAALRVDVSGYALPLLKDAQNRSIGFLSQADTFANQVPGARLVLGDGKQTLYLPEALASYDLVLQGRAPGGAYVVSATLLVDGQQVPDAPGGPHHTDSASGTVRGGQLYAATILVQNENVQIVPPLREVNDLGQGVHVAFAKSQAGTFDQLIASALATSTAPTPTPTATPTASSTPTATATPTTTPSATATEEPSPTATDTPEPTATELPTATTIPTATPVPPTATSVPATPVPEPTEAPEPTATTPPPPTPVPTPVPSPTSPPTRPAVPPSGPNTPAGQLFGLINASRAEERIGQLTWDPALAAVACGHNEDMIARGYFDHDSPEGEGPPDRILRGGVPGFRPGSVWGENLSIDRNVSSAHTEDMAEAPDDPDSHRTQIMNPQFTRVGICVSPYGAGSVLINEMFI